MNKLFDIIIVMVIYDLVVVSFVECVIMLKDG